MMESMAKTRTDCNSNELEPTLNDLKAYVERAARQGVAVHEVEAGIWHRVLHLGHQALRLLFSLIGPGDMGETVVLPDGQEVRRLERSHPRVYQSVFGRFEVERVVNGDGKGIPIRRATPEAPIQGHDPEQEAKTNRKKMAVVGTVYTIDPFVRTPEEVVASLFRSPDDDPLPSERPMPKHKRLWASLPHEQDGEEVSATEVTFHWLAQEVARRQPEAGKSIVLLMDGQKSLWEAGQRVLPQVSTIEILDLLHATPRIWDAAHLFYGRDEEQTLNFVYDRVLRILQGEVRSVVAGLRQMGTKRTLRGKKREKLAKLCGYLENNAHRMRYDEYLAAGYPIASGVIEGACRHFAKDRMERSGMRWRIESAQAMLAVRSIYLNGDWDDFMTYRIEKETQRLYPYREFVEPIDTLEEVGLPFAA